MNFLKKATDRVSFKKDLNVVVDYIKAGLKSELDRARHFQKNGINITFDDDAVLATAGAIATEVIKDFDEIQKRSQHQKILAINAKKSDISVLSPDEDYAIDMASIKDIKKAGLIRPLSNDERRLLKTATMRFNELYSEQIKINKVKYKTV